MSMEKFKLVSSDSKQELPQDQHAFLQELIINALEDSAAAQYNIKGTATIIGMDTVS